MAYFDIAANSITAQPVTAYLQGRAMRMAYEGEKQNQQFQQMQMQDWQKQRDFDRQAKATELEQKQQAFEAEQSEKKNVAALSGLVAAYKNPDRVQGQFSAYTLMGGDPKNFQPKPPSEFDAELMAGITKFAAATGAKLPDDLYPKPINPETERHNLVMEGLSARRAAAAESAAAGTGGVKPMTAAQEAAAKDRALKNERLRLKDLSELERGSAKTISALGTAADSANNVLSSIAEVMPKLGWTNTGVLMNTPLKNFPNAVDVETLYDTIRANTGFDALRTMRFESQTGGALGNTAIKEIEFLQSKIRKLDPRASKEQQRANLFEIQKAYTKIQKDVDQAIKEEKAWAAKRRKELQPSNAGNSGGGLSVVWDDEEE